MPHNPNILNNFFPNNINNNFPTNTNNINDFINQLKQINQINMYRKTMILNYFKNSINNPYEQQIIRLNLLKEKAFKCLQDKNNVNHHLIEKLQQNH